MLKNLADVSDISFSAWGGRGGVGVDFLLKIPEGGVSRRGRGAGRVSAANWGFGGEGGGG